jgi:hypothetical protein
MLSRGTPSGTPSHNRVTNTINKAGPTGPSFVAAGLLFSRVVRCHKKELCNWLRTEHGWPLDVHREIIFIICMSISWLNMEERLTSSLLVFMRGIDMLNEPNCLFELLAHSLDTHTYPTRHATRGLFTVPKSRTDYGSLTVRHRAMTTWNSIPHQITDASSNISDASSKIRF